MDQQNREKIIFALNGVLVLRLQERPNRMLCDFYDNRVEAGGAPWDQDGPWDVETAVAALHQGFKNNLYMRQGLLPEERAELEAQVKKAF